MSKVVAISSPAHFDGLLKTSKIVVADFFAEWCVPCHMIAPVFARLADSLARDNVVTFVKVDTEAHKAISEAYRVTSLPTFVLFRDGKVIDRVQGADPKRLEALATKLVQEASTAGSSSGSGSGSGSSPWLGAALPRGYGDITDQVEVTRCELLNVDPATGSVRVLFAPGGPGSDEQDWIESDTDEQIMLFVPFMSMVKLHTLQITSLPGSDGETARPRLIKLFSNTPHNLGFDEAEDTVATQEVELGEADWNADGTASIGLRFVKFQKVNTLVVFVVSADGDGDKVRLDRLRLIGESGEKREMGKLEKIGDELGE
ncbi:proteasome-interacting thioredoxin protein [Grosmannia clavigera kw1407]|uniref:Proteasome-interacting thioredoxin protein n=1 Tax=Grosmannia clavigera (strain kw1407 / UAMH 11150) TaxID=655863 RepID=F0XR65_GROCL|nr:proteasome-interacting thioredoxin protein [Grosmannia clavigera kw1407]EFW99744.1 proteasome-interacting thioredoxin protein [Grosmannia clavigera kw1407]